MPNTIPDMHDVAERDREGGIGLHAARLMREKIEHEVMQAGLAEARAAQAALDAVEKAMEAGK